MNIRDKLVELGVKPSEKYYPTHIDPKEWGKYPEPNHVDVNRLKSYNGALEKKKLSYKE